LLIRVRGYRSILCYRGERGGEGEEKRARQQQQEPEERSCARWRAVLRVERERDWRVWGWWWLVLVALAGLPVLVAEVKRPDAEAEAASTLCHPDDMPAPLKLLAPCATLMTCLRHSLTPSFRAC
jgi:hypothetical protein